MTGNCLMVCLFAFFVRLAAQTSILFLAIISIVFVQFHVIVFLLGQH